MTAYEVIFETFLAKIEDFCLANEIIERPTLVVAEMSRWLHSAVAKTKKMYNQTITLDDTTHTITETLNDLEIEVFSLGMVCEWLRPKLYSVINTSQMIGGKEEKFYSQAGHITSLRSLFKDCNSEKNKIVRDYGYINNSYLTSD